MQKSPFAWRAAAPCGERGPWLVPLLEARDPGVSNPFSFDAKWTILGPEARPHQQPPLL